MAKDIKDVIEAVPQECCQIDSMGLTGILTLPLGFDGYVALLCSATALHTSVSAISVRFMFISSLNTSYPPFGWWYTAPLQCPRDFTSVYGPSFYLFANSVCELRPFQLTDGQSCPSNGLVLLTCSSLEVFLRFRFPLEVS